MSFSQNAYVNDFCAWFESLLLGVKNKPVAKIKIKPNLYHRCHILKRVIIIFGQNVYVDDPYRSQGHQVKLKEDLGISQETIIGIHGPLVVNKTYRRQLTSFLYLEITSYK